MKQIKYQNHSNRIRVIGLVLSFVFGLAACKSDEILLTVTPVETVAKNQEFLEKSGDLPASSPTQLLAPTLSPTGTPFEASPTINPTKTPTQQSPQADVAILPLANHIFAVQDGTPFVMQSWLKDCNWMGIAGQVFSSLGFPLGEIIVEAGGELNGESVLDLAITGLDSGYGPGGYELTLADRPVESFGDVWVQLKDSSGEPISPIISIDTFGNCDQNLMILNFSEGQIPGKEITLYFPLINR